MIDTQIDRCARAASFVCLSVQLYVSVYVDMYNCIINIQTLYLNVGIDIPSIFVSASLYFLFGSNYKHDSVGGVTYRALLQGCTAEKAKFKIPNSVCIVTSGNCYIREPNASACMLAAFACCLYMLAASRPAPLPLLPSPSQPADTEASSALPKCKERKCLRLPF